MHPITVVSGLGRMAGVAGIQVFEYTQFLQDPGNAFRFITIFHKGVHFSDFQPLTLRYSTAFCHGFMKL